MRLRRSIGNAPLSPLLAAEMKRAAPASSPSTADRLKYDDASFLMLLRQQAATRSLASRFDRRLAARRIALKA